MRRALLGALLLVGPAACGETEGGTSTAEQGATPSTTITVFAASSLTDVMAELIDAFEATDDVEVDASFAGSSALVQQIDSGAEADVLVTADEQTMAAAREADHVGASLVVARNELALLVEPGNPKSIRALADLARSDVVVVLCAPAVPCGRLAATALERARVAVSPASLEENVKGVVAKLTLGEADAGIAYVTDGRSAGDDVEVVDVDLDDDLTAQYGAAVVTASDEAEAARQFIDFLGSDDAELIFGRFGFLPAD